MLYYTYVLKYPDGRVFYVGKGHDNRILYHEWEARKGKKSHKCNTIRKIWADGGEVVREIVFETPDEQAAFLYEWVLINLVYGRETLTNLTDGGDGVSGLEYTEEYRLNMSKKLKERVFTEEHRLNLSKGVRRHQTEATRKKLSVIQEGKEIPQAQRDKIRAKLKDRPRPRDVVERIAASNAKTWAGLVSPDGTVYRDIHNLRQFCKLHGLTQSAISHVMSGKRAHHKGWRKLDDGQPTTETTKTEAYGHARDAACCTTGASTGEAEGARQAA